MDELKKRIDEINRELKAINRDKKYNVKWLTVSKPVKRQEFILPVWSDN